MATDLADIVRRIEGADWDALYPRLMDYADLTLRSALGWSRVDIKRGRPCVEGLDAEWFISEAIDKTMAGTRKWDPESIDLYWHLHETVRSLIHSQATSKTVLARQHPNGDGFDPIDNMADTSPTPDEGVVSQEISKLRQEHFLAFRESIAGDKELCELMEAFTAEYTDPKDIADVSSLAPERVSELKRKFRAKYLNFTDKYKGPLEKSDLVREQK